MAGRVRPLVPFFVSSSDGTLTVNDALHVATPSSASAPLVELAVRTWDVDQGVFKDAVHVVRDLPPPQQKKNLLTPAEIKRKRARGPSTSMPEIGVSPSKLAETSLKTKSPERKPYRKSIHVAVSNIAESKGEPSFEQKPASNVSDEERTPSKPRPFAGSTFEAASPAPNGLPIPSFVRREMETPSEDVVDAVEFKSDVRETDVREKAALELRRMLKI